MLDQLTADDFHAHLDKCKQCEEHPFNLCPEGQRLMSKLQKEISED